jgi:hypothetical protein
MAINTVTIELLNYGVTPGSERVWVRALRKGFSVVVQNVIWKRPRRVYSSKQPYSWRPLARCLANLSNLDRINPSEDAAPHVTVKGEKGLVADILRHAYASGEGGMPDWVALLIDQTDDCLSHIEKVTDGHLSTEVQQRLTEIAYGIGELNLSRDLCALSRATDGSSKLDLKALWEELERQLDINAARETELREASIKPFREKIEAMIKDFVDRPVRGGLVTMPSKKMCVRRFLESYVMSHGRLPSGPIRVSSDSNSFPWDFGIINFDET